MLDARGIEINVGDSVIHAAASYGHGIDIRVGTVIGFTHPDSRGIARVRVRKAYKTHPSAGYDSEGKYVLGAHKWEHKTNVGDADRMIVVLRLPEANTDVKL